MGQASQTAFSRPLVSLEKVQELYDSNQFQHAYQLSTGYWNQTVLADEMSADEMVLAVRLSARLGGFRISRWLARKANERFGQDPKVRYYTSHISRARSHVFDDFRLLLAEPELQGADPDTQASWLAYSAVRWATIRDFKRAHECLARAESWSQKDGWIPSCRSDVLGMEDRWDEALEAAEQAWSMRPGTPYSARSLGSALLNLRRVREAAERLAEAAGTSESYELPLVACWYLGAMAETCKDEERTLIINRAAELALRMETLAPLADRETRALFARTHLDIAELTDDHTKMATYAKVARSPFHRKVLENLRKNPHGVRVRLPFKHAIQKHNECLPTSIGSSMEAMGTSIDAEGMAAEITFGGTPEWAAAEWLEKRGFVVRFFAATPEVSASLIKKGFAFVATIESDSNAHAVAVVGMDEAAGTLLIHDPQGFRATEYLIEAFGKSEAPLGPKAMVAVLPEKAADLDQILPVDDSQAMEARQSYHRAQFLHGPEAARNEIARITERLPSHPVTRALQALAAVQEGRAGTALSEFQKLLEAHPGSAFIRSNLLDCCRSLGNTAMMRNILADVVERGLVPGIRSEQNWQHPPAAYVVEYADFLGTSSETRGKAISLLHGLIRRWPSYGPAWHVLGDLLWYEHDMEGALLGYRVGTFLEDRDEHYARAYCDALAHAGREDEGLAWMESRARRLGSSFRGVVTWITWIDALEDMGRPKEALAAAQEAVALHPDSPELLAYLSPLNARLGHWEESKRLLHCLGDGTGNPALFNEASLSFDRLRGELDDAIGHAQAWLREQPLSMRARNQLIDLIDRRDGTEAAIRQARDWMLEYPEHDQMEQLYCRQLARKSYASWRKYSVLLHRVKRNAEDSWAWRELAFSAIHQYQMADGVRQKRLEPRIVRFLAQCERTAGGNAATVRAHAQWSEARAMWSDAIETWLAAIELDPASLYSYNHIWDCAAGVDGEQQVAIWRRLEAAMVKEQGRSSTAREVLSLAAQRFGVSQAEEAAARLRIARPDDPEVIHGSVELLLHHGQGRTDYERALAMLEPELQRFPFNAGLRFSHADALRKLRRFTEAEEALAEILRRHPDNSSAQVQLAWVHQNHGRTDQALHGLEAAALRDPYNDKLLQTRAEILIAAHRHQEARQCIMQMISKLPAEVGLRESAIRMLFECGADENAVEVAREGILQHPRGAYLWLVLGKTLYNNRRYAAQGEIEHCLRRSLKLNPQLYQATDYLAMLLVEQRQYAEAEEVVTNYARTASDKAPPLARLAWVHRKQGQTSDALKEMTAVVQQFPWCEWGWKVLMEWLVEDKDWDASKKILGSVPPEVRTDVQLRYKRLEVLNKAGLSPDSLDVEWKSLLHDFPEDLSLHLLRYDALRQEDSWPKAALVLEKIEPIHPDSPYLLARRVEVLTRDRNKEESVSALMRIFFAPAEFSNWPVDYSWQAIQSAQYSEAAYQQAWINLSKGRKATKCAIAALGAYVLESKGTKKLRAQPYWRAWFPDAGANEILNLLELVRSTQKGRVNGCSPLLKQLSDYGYMRIAADYWRDHQKEVEADIECWSEVARALTALRRKSSARKLLAGWRQREGVEMWAVANYVVASCGLKRSRLLDVKQASHDALLGLPHDHCARFLAHMETETCALLGDVTGFQDAWQRNQAYFNGKLDDGEWFGKPRRYLLAAIPELKRHLENHQLWKYRLTLWNMRGKRFIADHQAWFPQKKKFSFRSWWWLVWLLLLLLRFAANL